MELNNQIVDVNNFNIIFEQLALARQELSVDFQTDLVTIDETQKTVALFKEFQDSFFESSYSIITRS
jgi:hypothetical protein